MKLSLINGGKHPSQTRKLWYLNYFLRKFDNVITIILTKILNHTYFINKTDIVHFRCTRY